MPEPLLLVVDCPVAVGVELPLLLLGFDVLVAVGVELPLLLLGFDFPVVVAVVVVSSCDSPSGREVGVHVHFGLSSDHSKPWGPRIVVAVCDGKVFAKE